MIEIRTIAQMVNGDIDHPEHDAQENKKLEDLLNSGWEIVKIDHSIEWHPTIYRIVTLMKKL